MREQRAAEVDAQHEAAAAKQAERGKRGARQRVLDLLDAGSFQELDPFVQGRSTTFGMERSRPYGDGVVTGFGTIDGRAVAVFSQDFTVFGGSLGEAFAEKMVKLMDLAARYGCPVIGINDSAGARIQEGVEGLAGYGEVFFRNVRASGVVPQISDHRRALRRRRRLLAGDDRLRRHGRGHRPDVHHRAGCHPNRHRRRGHPRGARRRRHPHGRSGVAHLVAADEDDLNAQIRYLLSYLPVQQSRGSALVRARRRSGAGGARARLRSCRRRARSHTTCTRCSARSSTAASSSRSRPATPPNIICGFGRLDGHAVGVVANQPRLLAGTLDIAASEKAARFVRICDAFNVPLIVFVDVPGFLPGIDQEHDGIIRHGSKLLYAFAEATVPRITVITRKAYGGAYVVMNSQAHRRRLRYRLADRRDRGDGSGGGRRARLPPRAGCRR